MAYFVVADRTAFFQALKAAASGDTIALEAGSYSNLKINELNIAGDLTITSKDAGNPAILTDLTITKSSGLNFSNLEFSVRAEDAGNPFKVTDSHDVHFDRVNVHGSMDDNPQNDGSAMQIRRSSDVSVTNSEFQQLSNGLSHLDSDHLVISGNSFHDLQIDAVRGGGSSFVTISDNHFTDFFREAGDHPDAIQFWTSNTKASAHDIVITGNIIERGDGGPMQGIFIKDESGGKLPYHDVKIAGNLIVGSMWNGISVNGATGLEISDNIVAGFADMKARIALKSVSDVTLTGNQATDYIRQLVVEMSEESGNTRIGVPTDGGLDILGQWATLHFDSRAVTSLLSGDDGLIPPALPGFEPPYPIEGPPTLHTPVHPPEGPLQLLYDLRFDTLFL